MHRASIVLAFAAILPNLDTLASAKKVLELGLTRDIKGTPAPATGSKDSVDTDLTGITAQPAGVLFSVELTVGSDQQPVKVQVDTGSSDLWLPDVTSSICANPQNLCNAALKGDPLFFGGFDPSSSTTLQQQDDLGQFFITYADGTEIHGGFVADTVSISGEPVNDVIIAVANNGTSDFPINGIMGVGFTSGEAGVSQGLAREHLNFPASLKEQGLISTLAYSVYLNDAGTFTPRNPNQPSLTPSQPPRKAPSSSAASTEPNSPAPSPHCPCCPIPATAKPTSTSPGPR